MFFIKASRWAGDGLTLLKHEFQMSITLSEAYGNRLGAISKRDWTGRWGGSGLQRWNNGVGSGERGRSPPDTEPTDSRW